MEKKIKKDAGCTPCQDEFLSDINDMVNEVEGYTSQDHDEKKQEIEDAFGKDQDIYSNPCL